MNIAMLSYHTCPLAILGGKDTGGMNVYVRELTRFLGQAGVHVDVFTRSQNEHVPHVLHDLGYGNRVVHIPAGPETPLSRQGLVDYIPEFAAGIQRFSQEKNIHYDLIHSHYWMSGIAAQTLKNAWSVPVVQMFHTLGIMKNRIARTPEEKEGGYRIEGEQKVINFVDRIIAATPAELSQLEFLYKADKKKITIIPPGVDIGRFYPMAPEEACDIIGAPCKQKMLLFVGRIEPLKGVDTLLQAIAILHRSGLWEEHPHCLTIIGGNPDQQGEDTNAEMTRLQTLSRTLGLEDLVLFLGKRDQNTLPYYYAAAEAVIVPSHYESFGMVALEAMACGTPVVASQVGGLAFLVQDETTGFVIPDNDPQALADRLERIIRSPELRSRMGQQAYIYAQNFAWERITSQVKSVYEQLLQD